jgi:hypothetical protein
MVYLEEREIKPEEMEWFEWLRFMTPERKERKYPPAICHDRRRCIDGRHRLNPVKFSKPHKMVIVAMGPEYSIDMG